MLERVRGGLIVSCQAAPEHPMRSLDVIGRLAAAAELGGAIGLRIEGEEDIRHVRDRTGLPIIGLKKTRSSIGRPGITRSIDDCLAVAAAGAGVVALEVVDDVDRPLAAAVEVLRIARRELSIPLLADVSTSDEASAAIDAGADAVATTLAGYTPSTAQTSVPDFDLVERIAARGIRVIAEGSLTTPAHVAQALSAGAWAVVVGGAITDPLQITARFARAARLMEPAAPHASTARDTPSRDVTAR